MYPDLVVGSADGQIESVQYQKLVPVLLNELQKEHRNIQQQDELIRQLQEANRRQGELSESLQAQISELQKMVQTLR